MLLELSFTGADEITNLVVFADRKEEEREEGDIFILIDSYTPAGLVTSRLTTEI
jgi:hypothetical protein